MSCTPGLEAALAEELAELGLEGRTVRGGAEVRGPVGTYELVNLWSRVASRVSLAPHPASGRPLPAAQGEVSPGLDTSGELLYFRGYRQEVGRAPLRETLAAGLLRLARWRPEEPLWDVMCGSGTILIEAAERALGLAPGRARRFAFEDFPTHDAARWRARPRTGPAVTPRLFGSDLNAGALGVARRNARRAGVLEHLTLERFDATALPARPGVPPGLVLSNLPYGKRVGARGELGALFEGLGASLRRACPGWRFAFLLQGGADALGLPLDSRAAVSNGGLRCEFVCGKVPLR